MKGCGLGCEPKLCIRRHGVVKGLAGYDLRVSAGWRRQ
ncbi:MAG: hypothetical protein FD149_2540, partial [Rhodospirillaceae bacterium]